MNAPAIKLKKCRMCPERFPQFNSLHVVCSPACAIRMAEENPKALGTLGQRRLKAERKIHRQKKLAAKPLKKWLDEAQFSINRWVREVRDEGMPCISCGRHADSYDAGHFRSRGAASHLRFDERNIWRQCSRPCNHDLSGNILAFRKALIGRIGQEGVESLEDSNTPKKWTIEEARAIKDKYNALYNEWKKTRR